MTAVMAAARVLQGVIDQGQSIDAVLEEVSKDSGERLPEIQETAYGGCRFYVRIDAVISALVSRPLRRRDRLVHFVLACAIYQIEYMRVPDHAVVNNSVGSLDGSQYAWAKKLVNGVLRNFIRNRVELLDRLQNESTRHAFPQFLYDRIWADWPAHAQTIIDASNQKPPLTLRVNRLQISRGDYARLLETRAIGFTLTRDSETGITLDSPLPVNRVPGFGLGYVSVQDESAQLVPSCLRLQRGHRVLDACAAPGGKTGLILESRADIAGLDALDLPHRTDLLHQNLDRLSLRARVIPGDFLKKKTWWDGEGYDRVLLDAPCSGSGVIRRHPDIKYRRLPGDIKKFAALQCDMLDVAWSVLKSGGVLLYVTCSIFKEENDGVIGDFVQGRTGCELQSLPGRFGVRTRYGRQRLPGDGHAGDGFFYCRIGKL
ncbi:MAG: 16S rRNA (cytosine(967)-C(5))-methyltransferase RsmB [Gammaproteobacteria bacterium]|nr:16S rRNA (cytosine(967)-C(5))-methyltransferase RsmB [Gammaproteobacteria bacterium]